MQVADFPANPHAPERAPVKWSAGANVPLIDGACVQSCLPCTAHKFRASNGKKLQHVRTRAQSLRRNIVFHLAQNLQPVVETSGVVAGHAPQETGGGQTDCLPACANHCANTTRGWPLALDASPPPFEWASGKRRRLQNQFPPPQSPHRRHPHRQQIVPRRQAIFRRRCRRNRGSPQWLHEFPCCAPRIAPDCSRAATAGMPPGLNTRR